MIAPILPVRNLDASIHFYTEKLGFEKLFLLKGSDGRNNFAFIAFGEQTQIGLSAASAPAPAGSGVVFLIYPPQEVSFETLYTEMQSRGVVIEQPLREEYWGDHTFSVKDPDGYALTFARMAQGVSVV